MNPVVNEASSRKFKLILAAMSLLGAVILFLASSRHGSQVSHDSVAYIAAARNIVAGRGFTNYTGEPLVLWPPAYPSLLAAILWMTHFDPIAFAHSLHAVLLGCIIYLAGLLFYRYLHAILSERFILFVSISMVVGWPLHQVSLMLMSEPLFICMTLVYLICMSSYRDKPDGASLIMLAVATCASCLTRYIGVTFILAGAGLILLVRHASLRTKFAHLFAFGFLATFPLGLWMLRNYQLSGELLGPRAASSFSFWQNLGFALDVMLSWYVPGRLSGVSILLYALAAIWCLVVLWRLRGNFSAVPRFITAHTPLLLPIAAYASFLIYTSTTTAYEKISSRLLSPIFVPLSVVFVVLLVKSILYVLPSLRKFHRSAVLISTLMIWIGFSAKVTATLASNAFRISPGYVGISWENSEVLDHLRSHRERFSGTNIYSNAPDATYLLADYEFKRTPRRRRYNSPVDISSLTDFGGKWPEEGSAHLIWLDKVERPSLYTLDELKTVAHIELVTQLADGGVYTVRRN